jgi:hypothetical protein
MSLLLLDGNSKRLFTASVLAFGLDILAAVARRLKQISVKTSALLLVDYKTT